MTVKEYYYQHFNELSPDKKFHFATRMKNYFRIHDFDEYLKSNRPDLELAPILNNNDFSRVSNYELRKPFFEKYAGLYGVEAALFRLHHLMAEYNIDIRDDFVKLYPKEKLFALSDALMKDKKALEVLSTWAINTIYLTEELFPRGKNVIKELGEWALTLDINQCNPTLLSYLYTHIFLCETGFYSKDVAKSKNLYLLEKMLKKCADVNLKNIDSISLDASIEFLVCSNMAKIDFPDVRAKIAKICKDFQKDTPYLINYRRATTPNSHLCTIDGAEHINVLYIMSGLDK